MDAEWLRQLCLSFPGTTEQIQWGYDLLFKVGGKMFAITPLEAAPVCLSFKASPERFAELTERQNIIPAPYLARAQWVALETRDATDGYLHPKSTVSDLAGLPAGGIHPLTGPVLVKGARPGDLLEVEFIDIVPQRWAFTAIMPGLGFLRDIMTTPYMVHWDIADGWATSRQLPNVRIPGAPFMGVSGVAPARQQVEAWTKLAMAQSPADRCLSISRKPHLARRVLWLDRMARASVRSPLMAGIPTPMKAPLMAGCRFC